MALLFQKLKEMVQAIYEKWLPYLLIIPFIHCYDICDYLPSLSNLLMIAFTTTILKHTV